MFKRRKLCITKRTKSTDLFCGIFSVNQMRFEFVYLRTVKKLFRKKYVKKKNRYSRNRY